MRPTTEGLCERCGWPADEHTDNGPDGAIVNRVWLCDLPDVSMLIRECPYFVPPPRTSGGSP